MEVGVAKVVKGKHLLLLSQMLIRIVHEDKTIVTRLIRGIKVLGEMELLPQVRYCFSKLGV